MSTRFNNNLPAIRRRLHARASDVVRTTVAEIEARIRTSFSEPKSGRMYGAHQASAPGEAPARDQGALASSTQAFMDTDTQGGVGVGMAYGPDLEYGTSKMEPRPFMVPAAESVSREFHRRLRNLT